MRQTVCFIGGLGSLLFGAQGALAQPTPCTAPGECILPTLLPFPGGELPPNTPSFLFIDRGAMEVGALSEPEAALFRIHEDGTEEELELKVEADELWPADPLEPSASYRFTLSGSCALGETTAESSFHTSAEPAGIPTSLVFGGLWSSERFASLTEVLVVEGDVCGVANVPTTAVDVYLDLAEIVVPWAPVLTYDTIVDGVVHAAATPVVTGPLAADGPPPMAMSRLHVVCDPSFGAEHGLAEGWHSVQMIARLPGTDVVLMSEVIEVDLGCELPAECEPGTYFEPTTGECLPHDVACPYPSEYDPFTGSCTDPTDDCGPWAYYDASSGGCVCSHYVDYRTGECTEYPTDYAYDDYYGPDYVGTCGFCHAVGASRPMPGQTALAIGALGVLLWLRRRRR